MNKKRQSVIILTVLLILCLFVFTACNKQVQVDLNEYVANGSDNLNIVGKLVKLMHEWIGNYGWTVVIFTVALKLVMIPFDLWQRTSTKKNTIKMQRIQPLLDNIDKKYGANTQKANEEKQKLYKKQSVSTLSSCLPMIVTMAIFIFMFSGLNEYATYSNVTSYKQLQSFYNTQYEKALTDEEIQDKFVQEKKVPLVDNNGEVTEAFEIYCMEVASKGNGGEYVGITNYYKAEVQESFLWMESIWQPDTWENIMPDYQKFSQTVNIGGTNPVEEYNLIRAEVVKAGRSEDGGWNGLMILPLLSVALSFASMKITQLLERKNKNGEVVQNDTQAQSNKMMMFMMPAMMAIFGFMYTGAFAVYMVCNYTLSILFSVILKKPVDLIVEKQLQKIEDKEGQSKASYKR